MPVCTRMDGIKSNSKNYFIEMLASYHNLLISPFAVTKVKNQLHLQCSKLTIIGLTHNRGIC